MPTFPISSSSSSHLLLPSSSSSSSSFSFSFFFFFFSGGGGGSPHHLKPSSSSSSSSSSTKTIILNPPPNNNNNYKLFQQFNSSETTLTYRSKLLFSVVTSSNNSTSNFDLPPAEDDNNDEEEEEEEEEEEDTGILDSETQSVSSESQSQNGVGVDIEIDKIGNNSRRIRSRISIDASLETVWELLTDYEGLSDFIPGLSVSQLLEKGDNFARLFQVGQQNLAFGVNFNAKGIVDCYEKDLEILPFGRRRDIDFKMVEGDFQTFQGKWSIEETYSTDRPDVDQISGGGECHTTTTTTLSYIVDVKPKLWLPVGLVEGRLCREVSLNLLCIREEAQKTVKDTLPTC